MRRKTPPRRKTRKLKDDEDDLEDVPTEPSPPSPSLLLIDRDGVGSIPMDVGRKLTDLDGFRRIWTDFDRTLRSSDRSGRICMDADGYGCVFHFSRLHFSIAFIIKFFSLDSIFLFLHFCGL